MEIISPSKIYSNDEMSCKGNLRGEKKTKKKTTGSDDNLKYLLLLINNRLVQRPFYLYHDNEFYLSFPNSLPSLLKPSQ